LYCGEAVSSAISSRVIPVRDAGISALALVIKPLQAALAAPSLLYLATLTVMLFRPPDLEFFSLDRVAFVLLVAVVLLRALLLRQSLTPPSAVIWPMAGLLVLVVGNLLSHPFDASLWSVAVAKYFVPFAMFYLSGLVFEDEASVRRLETFVLVMLGYLSFTAIAFLVGVHSLVWPSFILDVSLGIQAERARGPFLQAVANGVTLNCLGLIALDSYRRGRLRGVGMAALLGSLPVAILATKTRAVWLSFAVSMVVLLLRTPSARLRRVCLGLVAAGTLVVLVLAAGFHETDEAMQERLNDRNTVEFRLAAYRAGWQMFLDRPITGWGASQVRTEMENRLQGFRGQLTVVHNTYVEVMLEHGLIGFALYAWIIVGLFKLGARSRTPDPGPSNGFLQPPCRPLWPLLLGVYFVNATFVVMNYQFVNGLLFTLAGILARRGKATGMEVGVRFA
jgi:O-antigen ligase